MNRHQFHQIAKQFRAGRITINEFADQILGPDGDQQKPRRDSPPVTGNELEPRLPDRPADGHKGTFGHVLAIAGSRNMPGAAALVAMAAGRCGCGLVTVATPNSAHHVVAGFDPCYMTFACCDDGHGQLGDQAADELGALLERVTAIAIGPGLGQSPGTAAVVKSVFANCRQPVVVDADALNVLAASKTDLTKHAGPRVLTPHPGELLRLLVAGGLVQTGETVELRELEKLAGELAREHSIIVVVKSHQVFVSDGKRNWRNSAPPNPGLATGGSGDVLTGIVASLCAQQLDPAVAAVTGVAIHSMAGRAAVSEGGSMSLVSTELVAQLSRAIGMFGGIKAEATAGR